MKTLYSTTVNVVGGRNGAALSDDGFLDLKLAQPAAIGGRGNATNPEQLFAAGYAGCFGSAVIHVAGRKHKVADDQVAIAATVGLNQQDDGGVALSVALAVTITGVDQPTAEAIVEEAHRTCPYSKAVRGNIDVQITVSAA